MEGEIEREAKPSSQRKAVSNLTPITYHLSLITYHLTTPRPSEHGVHTADGTQFMWSTVV